MNALMNIFIKHLYFHLNPWYFIIFVFAFISEVFIFESECLTLVITPSLDYTGQSSFAATPVQDNGHSQDFHCSILTFKSTEWNKLIDHTAEESFFHSCTSEFSHHGLQNQLLHHTTAPEIINKYHLEHIQLICIMSTNPASSWQCGKLKCSLLKAEYDSNK